MTKAVTFIMKSGQSNNEGVPAGMLPSYGPGVSIFEDGRPGNGNRFGYEDAIIRGLRANGNTDDIVVSQWAWGGTPLRQRDGDDWSPQSEGEYFDKAMAFHKANFEALVAQGYDEINAQFIWDQGQGDSHSMAWATAYQGWLTELFAAVRAELGMPDLHFHVIEISNDPNYKSVPVLQQSQNAAVEADGNATIYKSDGLEHRDGDYNHVTETGQAEQGEAILKTMLGEDAVVSWGRYFTSGNDTVVASKGDDVLFGKEGNDLLRTGAGADQLFGGNGNDKLAGGADNDYVNGGNDNDILYGNGGNDLLFGGRGDDFLYGSAGADRLDGSDGINTADYFDAASGVTVNLATGKGSGGDAEGDRLIRIQNIRAGDHADTLIGDAGANMIAGRNGGDFIWAGGGSDQIFGNNGRDTLFFASTDFTGSELDTVSGFTLRGVDALRFEGYETSDITFEVGAKGTTLTLHEGGAVDGQILLVGITDVLGLCQQITLL